MIPPEQAERLLRYVLDDLPDAERAALDAALAEDAELRAALREVTDDMAAWAEAEAGECPELPTAMPAAVSNLKARAKAEAPQEAAGTPEPVVAFPIPEATPASNPLLRWAWPVAAAVLLGLNVWQLSDRPDGDASADDLLAQNTSGANPRISSDVATLSPAQMRLELERLTALSNKLNADLAQQNDTLDAMSEEITAWREQATLAMTANQAWQGEYARLLDRVSPLFDPADNLSRYTVIELADPTALASGAEVVGFRRYAEDVLMSLGSPPSAPQEAVGPAIDTSEDRLALAGVGTDDPNEVLTSSLNAPPQTNGQPAAFTVWNEDQQAGFIDFYDLPTPGDGMEFRVYIQTAESDAYQSVGTLDRDFISGSVSYEPVGENLTITGMVVAEEPIESTVTQPSGTIILRGP